MGSAPELSIIIVSYNTRQLLTECVRSIQQHLQAVRYEIIVVDNASHDDSVCFLREYFPDVIVVELSENRGFAGANNAGIAQARGDFVLLLNSDTVIRNDGMRRWLDFMKNTPQAGVSGCRIVQPDGMPQLNCFRVPNFVSELMYFGKGIIAGFWDPVTHLSSGRWPVAGRTIPVPAVEGTCLLIRREVLSLIGGLDDTFFLYYEDVEFCYRLRRKSGFRVYAFPDFEILHVGGASSPRDDISRITIMRLYISVSYFMEKRYGRYGRIVFQHLCAAIWRINRLFLRCFLRYPKCRKKYQLLSALQDIVFIDRDYSRLSAILSAGSADRAGNDACDE